MIRIRNCAVTAIMVPVVMLAQEGTIPAFKIEESDIVLSRLAQPGTYFDKVGRKFALLGYESGSFEAWAYPLKLLRKFEFSFYIGSSTEPIRAKDIVRYIAVTPAVTTITYTFQSFTIEAHFVTPVREAGAFILLNVNSTEPVAIVCSFVPVLQPMWPAGIGGQSARWLDDIKAYRISEPTGKNTGYIGSPAASGMSYTPAHMLSDVPNQFKIEIREPRSVRGRFIPVIVAGGKDSRDSVKADYVRMARSLERLYRETEDHYRNLRQQTMQIKTPVEDLNLAFEWAKVAYDNLLVENPDLGLGLVAGLGASGTGGRPGFGWFFGGDTYINSFSLVSYGAFDAVREAIAFTRKWQRTDGKMAHELTQAASYVDWWKDYPYGYIHGDTSPFYVCAAYDYFRHTGDTLFIVQSWESIKKAYEWSLATDGDGDGLMDNKKAGLGALEYGPLTDIQSDIYTGAIWTRATIAMPILARVSGDSEYARKAERYRMEAEKTFREKFWDPRRSQYAYAFTSKGEHVDIVSPWSAVGFMWNLGDSSRSIQSLQKLNSAELTTDWGIRSISNKSRYYEALNYNYGAVWPFLTSWVATAQYKHGFALQGYNSLMATVRHSFDNSLGQVTEVFSGSQNVWPQEAVSHQGFCTAGVVLPFLRGLLGLEPDAAARVLSFSPRMPPDWKNVSIRNYRVGANTLDMTMSDDGSKQTWRITSTGDPMFTMKFHQRMSPDARITSIRSFEPGYPGDHHAPRGSEVVLETTLSRERIIEITYQPGLEILPPAIETKTGDENKGLKIISTQWEGKRLELVAEGLAGESYTLGLMNSERIKSVQGGHVRGSELIISVPKGPVREFVRMRIDIETR